MHLRRATARPHGRRQPPRVRQYWLRRALRQRREDGRAEGGGEHRAPPTERGEPAPDDHT